jgi:hypothetical protein
MATVNGWPAATNDALDQAAREVIHRAERAGVTGAHRVIDAYRRATLAGLACLAMGALGVVGALMVQRSPGVLAAGAMMATVGLAVALTSLGASTGYREASADVVRVINKRHREAAELVGWTGLPVAPAGWGYLYVLQFGSGTIKVGRTADPGDRLRGHRSRSRAYGVVIARAWISTAHPDHEATEADLINYAVRKSAGRVRREFFYGADFDALVSFATDLART